MTPSRVPFKRDHPCPVCGGHVELKPHQGTRCYGYLSDDTWARCTRSEYAGALMVGRDNAFGHRLNGTCGCGNTHGSYIAPAPTQKAITDAQEFKDELALQIWNASSPIEGSVAHKYLEGRGIELPLPGVLRCHEALRYFGDLDEMTTQTAWPALVAGISVWPSPEIVAIQRTYLSMDEAGQVHKAPVPSPKQRLGSARGGAIRLADPDKRLVIGEGMEDVLTVMQETGIAGWAVMGTGGLSHVLIPDTVRKVVIAADNDPDGLRAAYAAAMYWSLTGRTVKVVPPPAGFKDWNEHLLAGVA